jgi:magnesium-transporting ATPase (P-type)
MALAGFLSSSQATLYKNTESNTWQTTGNTSEASILVASAKCGFATDTHLLKDSYAINPTTIYPQIHALRIPFSSLRKMMCSVHLLPKPNYFHTLLLKKNTPLDDTEAIFTHIAIIKGAPERLINHVQKTFIETDEGVSIDWSNNIMRQKKLLELVSKENTSMAQNSLRVLALAIAPLTEKFVNENLMNLSVDNRLEAILGHSNLTLLGLYGFIDPPREGVSDAIATCHKAGVKVVMITGDQKLTAFAVAERIGLLNFNENQVTKIRIENVDKKEDFQQNTDSSLQEAVVLCSTLHNNEDNFAPYLDEESLDNIVSKALVFARAQPQDKLIIIESLKRQGHVVAMTGDGVNDAPALQSADIGVSMGISGTDVAKGASDLVLLDDNFCTIVTAVAEGKTFSLSYIVL